MLIHPIDILVIIAYFSFVVILGLPVSKRANKDMDSYFLGGNKLPLIIKKA